MGVLGFSLGAFDGMPNDDQENECSSNNTGTRNFNNRGDSRPSKGSQMSRMNMSPMTKYLGESARSSSFGNNQSSRVSNNNTNNKDVERDNNRAEQVSNAITRLDSFVEAYKTNKTDVSTLNNLMFDSIPDIASIMNHYYDRNYESALVAMNNVIVLMTTSVFSSSLLTYVKNKDKVYKWEEVKINVGVMISLALETSHSKMMDNTKSNYIDIIQDMYEFELKELQTNWKLTEDAALDLLVGVPKFGRWMNDGDIKNTFDTFLTMLINHGKCAIDYLNADNQKSLFYYLYKDENGITTKAVGQCLGQELIAFEEEEDEVLYQEYIKMLYGILNEHDIEEIRRVLRYMVKVRSKLIEAGTETTTVFDVDTALKYPNIKTALLDYVNNSEAAKKFLV